MIMTKNRKQIKPHQNMSYYTSPGPTFYVTPAIPTQFDTVLARESKDEEGIEHPLDGKY